MPSTARTTPPPPLDFSLQASLRQHGPRIEPPACWRARQVGARPKRCTRNQRHSESSGRRKHNRDPKGQRLRCLEAARAAYYCYNLFRHRLTPSRTSSRNYAMLSPSTPSVARQPNFTWPHAAAGKSRSTLPSRISGRAPRAARRGTRSAVRRPELRLMMTAASTIKRAAPAWHAPRLLQAATSVRHDHPWTTSRSSWRRPALTTLTPSSTSSGTVA
jgi:hypothetical protein